MHCYKSESRKTAAQDPCDSQITFDFKLLTVVLATALSLSACGTADKVSENNILIDPPATIATAESSNNSEEQAVAPLKTEAITNFETQAEVEPAAEPASAPAVEPAVEPEIEAEPLNITLATRRAEQGDVESQFALGLAYASGTPRVEKDLEQAKLWFELAAQNGNSEAQFELGQLFYIGKGTEKDYYNAREWWLESALQGNLDAQQKLGYLYSEGLGVERNYDQAQLWYKKAAQQGHAEAQTLLGSLYHEGNRIPTNYIEAFKWYKLAAEQGHPYAQYTLATLYHDGYGTQVDYIQCAAWIDVALANGYDDEFNVRDTCRGHLDETSRQTATHLANTWKKRYLNQGI